MSTRLAWLLAGLAWALRSQLELAKPDYYDPANLLDWTAVLSFSIAWLVALAHALAPGWFLATAPATSPAPGLGGRRTT